MGRLWHVAPMSLPPRFVAFTDGSSLKNPGGPGGTGFIVFDRANSALRFGGNHYAKDGAFEVTNNRMELRAVLSAIEGLPAGATIEVCSDSRYVIDALSKWIHGWRKKGWKTSTGEPVLNRDLIEAIDAASRPLKLTYKWVRGHNGHTLNELVDGLAQSAARKSTPPQKAEIVAALGSVHIPDYAALVAGA